MLRSRRCSLFSSGGRLLLVFALTCDECLRSRSQSAVLGVDPDCPASTAASRPPTCSPSAPEFDVVAPLPCYWPSRGKREVFWDRSGTCARTGTTWRAIPGSDHTKRKPEALNTNAINQPHRIFHLPRWPPAN
uniref:(northern house mosquito) hypothetical protein n=1 Tax=Culex pipiens TaxID=7175 RepID=A0A8D8HGF2_CULPI